MSTLNARISAFAASAVAATATALSLTNDEAQMLRDLRATRSTCKASEKQRKSLKAEVMGGIKQRLGIPADVKIAVELDDSRNPTYLLVKGDVRGTRRVLTTADFAPNRAGAVPVSNKRWYKVDTEYSLMDLLAGNATYPTLARVDAPPADGTKVGDDIVIHDNGIYVNTDVDNGPWDNADIVG